MHEGCTAAVMRSSVHPNTGLFGGGGLISDTYCRHPNYHHEENFQQPQYLDQQLLGHKMLYPLPPYSPLAIPPSPVPSSPATSTCSIIHQTVRDKAIENDYLKRQLSSSSSGGLEAIAAAAVAVAPHELLDGRGDAQLLGAASPQIFDHRSSVVEAFHETGELGCVVLGARRHLTWGIVYEEEQQQQHRGFHSRTSDNADVANAIPPPPFTPIHDVLSPPCSPMASPAMPPSPDCKVPEPRSVLDLATSPRPSMRHSAHAAHPNYDFGVSFLRGGRESGACGLPSPALLNTADDDFLAEFQRRDSSSTAQLLGLDDDDEDSSQRDPPAKSTIDWLQETSQLWMDSLMDDLTETPVHSSSLPRLDEEDDFGDEARTDTPSSSTPCPSELCHTSPSFDQEQSDDQGDGVDDDDEEEEEEEVQKSTFSKRGGRGATDACTAATTAVENDSSTTVGESNWKCVPNRESEHKLVNLLLGCAEAVSTESLNLVNPLFAQLGELASPEGTSMQRIAAYFTEALAIRCIRLWPQIYQPLPQNLDLSEEDCVSAFHILNHVSPYIKFAHFTANDIILQAFEGCDRVHVIDFDIKQGLQWPALFQSLAARPGGPPSHVRVTGVGEYKEDVQDTGDRLAEFAEALNLPFEFHAVIDKLEDVRLWMLHVKEKETVAVNCVLQLHRALQDSENGIRDLLGLITSTKPKVVAVVEQEASHNGRFLEGRAPRFLEALQYYSALFDSLESTMPPQSHARKKVEQFFAREVRNILACEGPERTERHEGIGTWRLLMQKGGFQSVSMSKRARKQAELLLEMFGCKSYTISQDKDALILGWETRSLFTASGWAPKLL